MRRKDFFTKSLTTAMAAAVALTPVISAVPVFAAKDSTDATNNTQIKQDLKDADIIDRSKTGSLTIHKYDITAAEAAQEYTMGSDTANGEKNTQLEQKLADYAIKGVQFTYLRVGNIETYSNTKDNKTSVEVVYEIPTALATILKLDPKAAYDMTQKTVANQCQSPDKLHYTSTQLSNALKAILNADAVGATSQLEEYMYSYNTQDTAGDDATNVGAVNMPLTDDKGVTSATGLPLGLYLLVETKVPEQVTDTTNPWFVSLPFTNMAPQEGTAEGSPNGGDKWLYDMVVYPKNQTGNPTLDKSVRNAYNGGGEVKDKNGVVKSGDTYAYDKGHADGTLVVYNNDSNNPANSADTSDAAYIANRGGYTNGKGQVAGEGGAKYSYDYEYRDTTTASAGDVLDYILVSKLPRISSKGSFLSEYRFEDILSKGLTNNEDVKIAFYDNKEDANANNTKNAIAKWDQQAGMFGDKYAKVTYEDGNGQSWGNGSVKMTVTMTEAGLNFLNGTGEDIKTGPYGSKTEGHDGRSDNSMSDMYMVVYYTATVNSDADLVLGDAGNPNDVVLEWRRTSDEYYNTLEDRNYVYAYSIDLTKRFSDDKGDLSKVEFKLYNVTDAYYVQAQYNEADNVYYVTGKTKDKDKGTTFVPKTDGKIIVYGLEADTYGMTEIDTDNGYTLLEDTIKVAITPTDREINASVAGTTGLDAAAVDAIVKYYQGGIYDENGDLVTASKDYVNPKDASRPAVQTADGRTIGKTSMYVGEVKAATAQVDDVDADMKSFVYDVNAKPDKADDRLNPGQAESLNATVVLDVVNNKNFELPATGGVGTIMFTLAGCGAALGGVMLVTKKSKKKEQ